MSNDFVSFHEDDLQYKASMYEDIADILCITYDSLVNESHVDSYACPYLVEGILADGRPFYFRYRHGRARLVIDAEKDTEKLESCSYGDSLAGCLSTAEFHALFIRLYVEITSNV